MSILHSDVEISSLYYVLHIRLSSGMSIESVNGGVWISLVGYVLGGGVVYGGPWYGCNVYGSHVGLGGGGFVGLVCLNSSRSSSGLLFSAEETHFRIRCLGNQWLLNLSKEQNM